MWLVEVVNSQGRGIYSTPNASTALKYNGSGKTLIALRTITGVSSAQAIWEEADWIGNEKYDSYYDKRDKTYVIRRAAQTLPCFLVHF